jgi:hypothetical protein
MIQTNQLVYGHSNNTIYDVEEIVSHSLPKTRSNCITQTCTTPTKYLVNDKWASYDHAAENTNEPLLPFGKIKHHNGDDVNISNSVPQLVADYADANDLFDDPIYLSMMMRLMKPITFLFYPPTYPVLVAVIPRRRPRLLNECKIQCAKVHS